MNNKSAQLGTEDIGRLLYRMSIPAVIVILVHAMYNFTDAIFIGQGVGFKAIAGITVVFPMQMIIFAIGITFGIGGASLISRALGAKDKKKAAMTLGNTVALGFATSLTLTIIGILFKSQILKLFGAGSPDVLKYAREYFEIIILGIPFLSFAIITNNAARAEGNAKVAMLTMIIGGLFNIALDPLFIFVFKMGVRGAAIATIISQFTSALFLYFYFQSGKSEIHFHFSYFRLKFKILRETMSIGVSSFARQVAGALLMIVMNHSLTLYGSQISNSTSTTGGEIAISIFGIIFRALTFIMMPCFGIAQGFQPIAGYNYGAKKYDRVKSSFHKAWIGATIFSFTGFLLFVIFPETLIKIFISTGELTKHPQMLSVGAGAVQTLGIMLPFLGFQIIGATLFQSLGKAYQAFLLSTSRQFFFLIPLILILPKTMGIKGIWISFPIANGLSVILTAFVVFFEMKKLRQATKN